VRASEAAAKAAVIMSVQGHCKHFLQDETGAVCFSGAIRQAVGVPLDVFWPFNYPPQHTMWRLVMDYAKKILEDEHGFDEGPIQWNNLEQTAGEDVILLLKKTAKELEEAGL
jgi:hypothetical protein